MRLILTSFRDELKHYKGDPDRDNDSVSSLVNSAENIVRRDSNASFRKRNRENDCEDADKVDKLVR